MTGGGFESCRQTVSVTGDRDALGFEESANAVVGMVFLVGQLRCFVDLLALNTGLASGLA